LVASHADATGVVGSTVGVGTDSDACVSEGRTSEGEMRTLISALADTAADAAL
jgi:hypothetical protein